MSLKKIADFVKFNLLLHKKVLLNLIKICMQVLWKTAALLFVCLLFHITPFKADCREREDETKKTWTFERYGFSFDFDAESEIQEESERMVRVTNGGDMMVTVYVEDRSNQSDEQLGKDILDFAVENGIELSKSTGTYVAGKSLSGAYIRGNIKGTDESLAVGAYVRLNTLWAFVVIIKYKNGLDAKADEVMDSLSAKVADDYE